QILRHASVEVTRKHYIKTDRKQSEAAMRKLDKAFDRTQKRTQNRTQKQSQSGPNDAAEEALARSKPLYSAQSYN
ncbi:MAG: hypothetical protein WCE52_03005, partial [Candidatus Acidiferrum sp.]